MPSQKHTTGRQTQTISEPPAHERIVGFMAVHCLIVRYARHPLVPEYTPHSTPTSRWCRMLVCTAFPTSFCTSHTLEPVVFDLTTYTRTFFYACSFFFFSLLRAPVSFFFFFLNDTAPPEIYPLPLHDALPISIVNEESPPPPEEVAHAKRVIEGNAKAAAEGRASFAIDGKMIDVPVVARAERLLARHAAIQAREATMPRPAA